MKSGIINVKKDAGMTSHDVVFKLRRMLHEKKIGHGGTLDPDVVGVLPIAVGRATRVIEYMSDAGKSYQGQITLGYATSTEDASGEIVQRTPVSSDLTEAMVDQAMTSFLGEIEQIPPMYSAVKVKGRKLYEYARAGQSVERPKRQVQIKSFERTTPLVFEKDLCRFGFKVTCGKGTYVRTLAVDLGQKLGYASHMSYLQRTAAAGLAIDSALSLEEISSKLKANDWSFLLPIEAGVADLPQVQLSQAAYTDISFGRQVILAVEAPLVAAFYKQKLVAILERRSKAYKPKKVLIE
ncbi:tRNA pseudouridine(55) synthase TruB [Streptococcus halichoeri]|uniref:tRNA pseudouridine(55) synthase TruB n=1 Tax=Streptococcus halichoeri TaxID=254785 RepID=UPI00135BA93E|nr:tRNA pseudouridine(55) synthase TruB [Streptococcus halichoeri]